MKKKDTTSSGASEWSSTPTGRITPMDIQQKEFRVARFGAGYRMREVDEFLDQVTDALSALVAENERLRDSGEPRASSSPDPVRPATDDADRAAVEAFLRREKGFLQDLGGLVQEHAEELRSMIRAARQSAPPAAAPRQEATVEPAEAAAAFEAFPETPDEPEAPHGSVEDTLATGTTEQATVATDASPEVANGDEGENEGADQGDDPETPGGSAVTITEAAAEEPIRLEEPEPARSGRQEEKEDGSLRELFWGEE